jgi:UDP-glucose 4-epimerase
MGKEILVTGGAGYIGSHTVVELCQHGYTPIIVDNFSNSNPEVMNRLRAITGQDIKLYKGEVQDKLLLSDICAAHSIDTVIHFAGYKAVGESVSEPLRYYKNNLSSTLALCEVMQEKGIKKLLFSSSATIYGDPEELPLKETSRTGEGLSNPYGWTKYMIEQMLRDLVVSDSSWQITSLRYFNPVGAHESGQIGEDPKEIPNNLLPFIAQVAVGKLDKLRIFGGDYDTPDGTGVRDYIHVTDLARGHVTALEHMKPSEQMEVFNLGTGRGVSVLEMVRAFEKASGRKIPFEIVARRMGDIASCYADPSKAQAELGWRATKTIEEACADSWRWQSDNPDGYRS